MYLKIDGHRQKNRKTKTDSAMNMYGENLGEIMWKPTLHPPADSPKIVTYIHLK